MNSKQKRAKRMRRKAHQKVTSEGVRRESFAGGTTVEVPRGPKPNKRSGHKRDPMKHGERLDAQGINMRALREIGVEDPTPSNAREFAKLVRTCGGDIERAKRKLRADLDKVYKERAAEIAQLNADATDHGFTAVDKATGQRVDPASITSQDVIDEHGYVKIDMLATPPTPDVWDELVATAKRRKRGVKTFAEKAGFALIKDQDPKVRESWQRVR